MFGTAMLYSSLCLGTAATSMAEPPMPGQPRRGFRASVTRPNEQADAIGYDLGLSARGRRFHMRLELNRMVHPFGLRPEIRTLGALEARKTGRVSTGVHWTDKEGHTHGIAVRTDRLSWLDLSDHGDAPGWNHKIDQTFGLAGVYDWRSSDDRPVRSAFHLGGGIRRSVSLASSWGGTFLDWEPVRAEATTSNMLDQQSSDISTSRPVVDLGQHNVGRSTGSTWTGGAQFDVTIWPGIIDGRVTGTVQVDQLNTQAISAGNMLAYQNRYWMAITSRTRLAARVVASERPVVPSVFLDLNASSVPTSGTELVVVPVYGVALTGGIL